MEQRRLLLTEISHVQIMYSEQDIDDYRTLKFLKDRLHSLVIRM